MKYEKYKSQAACLNTCKTGTRLNWILSNLHTYWILFDVLILFALYNSIENIKRAFLQIILIMNIDKMFKTICLFLCLSIETYYCHKMEYGY